MSSIKNHRKLLLTTLLASAVLPASSHAATVFDATRASLDGIVSQRLENAPAAGYYDGSAPNTSLVGGTGSNAGPTLNRYGQDIVYRYTLPTLNPGESIQSYTFGFQITAFRDHSGNDPQLQVYLLDTADPTTTGTDLFYRGTTNDPDHPLVGTHFEDAGANNGSINLDPVVNVLFTVNSGSALALLQSYYGGDHIPDQAEASFRFNLDIGNALDNQGLNRYFVNDDASTSSFEITAVPEPSAALLGGIGLLALLRRRRA